MFCKLIYIFVSQIEDIMRQFILITGLLLISSFSYSQIQDDLSVSELFEQLWQTSNKCEREDIKKEILNKAADSKYAKVCKAYAYIKTDEKAAKKIVHELLEDYPDFAATYMVSGTLKANVYHNYAGAVRDFDRCIKLDENFAAAYRNRGIVNLNLGYIETALKDLNKAITLNENDYHLYFYRGVARLKANKYDEASADLKKYTTIVNNNQDAYYYLDLAEFFKGNKKKLPKAKNYGELTQRDRKQEFPW